MKEADSIVDPCILGGCEWKEVRCVTVLAGCTGDARGHVASDLRSQLNQTIPPRSLESRFCIKPFTMPLHFGPFGHVLTTSPSRSPSSRPRRTIAACPAKA